MVTNRWARMSQLVDIDLEKIKIQLQAFEQEMDAAQAQFKSLSTYAEQAEADINQPTDYMSVQILSRHKLFLDSLRHAMSQQEQHIHAKHQHIEKIRQELLALYQKRESYTLLADKKSLEVHTAAEKKEADFLDDLAGQQHRDDPFDSVF